MQENKNYLASNIKILRNKKGITQVQLAKMINKTDSAICYWEKSLREPNVLDLWNLSNIFNISVSDLLFKDLRIEKIDDFENYFNTNKHLLTDEDKDMIKFIVEKRVKK